MKWAYDLESNWEIQDDKYDLELIYRFDED